MDFTVSLEEKLQSALAVLNELPNSDSNSRVLHLERLLRNVVANLHAMLTDIEAGCSWMEIGFFGDDEVADVLDRFDLEISTLRSLIQSAKMLER